MNQVTNLIQWKNLSKEDQAGFDFEGYCYEFQCNSGDWLNIHVPPIDYNIVCRLVIEPDKFYWTPFVDAYDGDLEGGVEKGSNITAEHIEDCDWLRPATEAEMPKPKPTDEEIFTQEQLEACLKKLDDVRHELSVLLEFNTEVKS